MKHLQRLVLVLGSLLILEGCTTTRYVPSTMTTDHHGNITGYRLGHEVEEYDPAAMTTAAIFIDAGLSQWGQSSGGTSGGHVSHDH